MMLVPLKNVFLPLDVIILLLTVTTMMSALLILAIPTLDANIPPLNAMILILVPSIHAAMNLDANTTGSLLMIITFVPLTLVMNPPVSLATFPLIVMMRMLALMIVATKKLELVSILK